MTFRFERRRNLPRDTRIGTLGARKKEKEGKKEEIGSTQISELQIADERNESAPFKHVLPCIRP